VVAPSGVLNFGTTSDAASVILLLPGAVSPVIWYEGTNLAEVGRAMQVALDRKPAEGLRP
jgi:hypothetical protein